MIGKFDSSYWALILGGSSGFGLATAHKLSRHGMNIAVVHRDRLGSMARIQSEFDAIKSRNVELAAYNTDALSTEAMSQVLDDLGKKMGAIGRIRVLLHSIAFGNLKPLAAGTAPRRYDPDKLARRLAIEPGPVQAAINQLFEEGEDALVHLVTPSQTPEEPLEEEDWARTVAAMGTSLGSWVQAVLKHDLFSPDARVLGLTSEGNRIAWKGYAAVAAAKASLESISRAIAVECAPFGVRANIIQAGVTLTPALKLIPGNAEIAAKARLRNPHGRLTRPEDVADFVCLMCMDEASWVNGNIICVDGGEHLGG